MYIIKTDCSGKMVVAFTIKEKNYLISAAAFLYISGTRFLISLRHWSCFRHSDKSGYCSLYTQFYKLL